MKRTDAEKLAKQLLRKHGLDVRRWTFAFDRAVQRLGCCNYWRKRITLSGPFVDLNNRAAVRDVLLHEIAHAIAGKYEGHGPLWRAVCLQIGAVPERFADPATRTPKPTYVLVCGGCGATYYRFRVKQGTYCGTCGPEVGTFRVSPNVRPKKSSAA